MLSPLDSGNLFSEAWKAAQTRQTAQEQAILDSLPSSVRQTVQEGGADFGVALGEQTVKPLSSVDQAVRAVDELPAKLVTGEVSDFHEIAAQLKRSELTFKFALEVRNKLIDAYREVMRMSV